MTESASGMPDVPPDRDVNDADVQSRLAEDPENVPNAPNRDPLSQSEAPVQDPSQRPGPLDPGHDETDLPSGVESYERPGRDGNWSHPTGEG